MFALDVVFNFCWVRYIVPEVAFDKLCLDFSFMEDLYYYNNRPTGCVCVCVCVRMREKISKLTYYSKIVTMVRIGLRKCIEYLVEEYFQSIEHRDRKR